MQEKMIEPAVVVEDHGGVSDVTMGGAPFAPAMAVWRQGIRQGEGTILLMYSLYTRDGDSIDFKPTCQRESQLPLEDWMVGKSQDDRKGAPTSNFQHVQRCSCKGTSARQLGGANVRFYAHVIFILRN